MLFVVDRILYKQLTNRSSIGYLYIIIDNDICFFRRDCTMVKWGDIGEIRTTKWFKEVSYEKS